MCGALGNPSHRVLFTKGEEFCGDSMCKLRGSAEPHCQLDSDSKSWKTGDNSDREVWRGDTRTDRRERMPSVKIFVLYINTHESICYRRGTA